MPADVLAVRDLVNWGEQALRVCDDEIARGPLGATNYARFVREGLARALANARRACGR